ncbi:MAG: iron-regulated protein [Phycisphaerales bacterium]|nr:iron-regulated protein [Phycisphaerales bacterium]
MPGAPAALTLIAIALWQGAPVAPGTARAADTVPVDSAQRSRDGAFASSYAAGAFAAYDASLVQATALLSAVEALCSDPTDARLDAARDAWRKARVMYGATEVYRFGDGPIDRRRGGVETFVNAWPVDESYIESAGSARRTGLLADRARYPVISRAILRELNQRGGETHVCTGWHAIEFMLWGRDTSDTGPGVRPSSDFLDGASPDADRRREFLREITIMLREDLEQVAREWRPDAGNYRAALVANPERAVRAAFVGVSLLTGFEMAGERLAVALETRDQEEEHSCFSDTTDADFKANIAGVAAVLRGCDGGPGLIDVVRSSDPARADALASALDAAINTVSAIPAPFDASIREPDGGPRRELVAAAMLSLERLSEQVTASAKALGIHLPTEPQG